MTAPAADTDKDGLADDVEQTILDTYRPWLYFDQGEMVWPCSATWFVQHSSLIHNPCGDISQSVLQSNPRLILQSGIWGTGYKHSQLKLNLDDGYRAGQFAGNPTLSTNVPIYGHVVPLLDNVESASLCYPGFPQEFGSNYIVAQYWMLFPHNDYHGFDALEHCYLLFCINHIADHEGDWVWMDVLLDKTSLAPQYVVYHHHGDRTIAPSVVPWNSVPKRDGAPIAYLEKGVHELWPNAGPGHGVSTILYNILAGLTQLLDFLGILDNALKFDPTIAVEPHQGNGLQYRPTKVINLGEAGRPIAQSNPADQLDSELALLFNGEWGDFTGPAVGTDVTNPTGPVNQTYPTLPSTEQLKIFDLGPSSLVDQLTALNNQGQVVGHLCNGRSFVWENGFAKQLQTPNYVCNAMAYTISENGRIGGQFYCYLGLEQPVIWNSPDTTYIPGQIFYVTNPPSEGYWGNAYNIAITDLHDSNGEIGVGGGWYGTTYRLVENRLYLQQFSPPFAGSPTPSFSRGNASGKLIGTMNYNGWIVAVSAGQANHVTVLSPTNGVHSGATSINDAGDIVGNIGITATLWKHDGTQESLWQDGNGASASSINNRNEIIGKKGSEYLIWRSNSVTRIADLVGTNSDWRPESCVVSRINDNGWMIGRASNKSNEQHAVVVILSPVIEPLLNRTVFRDTNVVISAKVFGALPLSFQWRRSGTNVTNGGRISGAQSATLTILAARAADQGDYQLEVSNQSGTANTTVRLNVRLPSINISRFNSYLSVSWLTNDASLEHSINPAGPWFPISGATSPYIVHPTNSVEFFRTSAP